MNIMKRIYVIIVITAALLTLLSALISKTVGVSDFYRGTYEFSLTANEYPPGTDDFVHKGFPVAYYTAYNVLPDPEMNHQNVMILYLLVDFLAIATLLYVIKRAIIDNLHK